MAAYAATVASLMKRAVKIDAVTGIGMFVGTVDITNYNTTLAGITGITGKFKDMLSVVGGVSDNGYLVEWVDASGSFKAYNPQASGSISTTVTQTTSTGGVVDDDDAASNGVALYLHIDELGDEPYAHLECVTAGDADALFAIGNGGPTVLVNDDDAAASGGLQLYFDEDAANTDERFLVNNTVTSTDLFIRASDGSVIRVKHDGSASSNGVAVYFDDDAANNYERLLFVSPTDMAGSYDTDDEVGAGATEASSSLTGTETALAEVDDDVDVGEVDFIAIGFV